MLDYIIQVLLFHTLFLTAYDLFLEKETFFQWNRAYLILTSILAYIIPLIKFESVQKIVPQEYIVMLPEVVLSPTKVAKQYLDWSSVLFVVLQYLFWLGIIVASILFLVKLYKILQLISNNEKENKGSYLLVLLENNTAFSFFNYIFLGKATGNGNKQQIIAHELIHVQQKHSLDLLLFEIQRIVCWFNPFSYIYQQRISELHEFIADSKAIKQNDRTTYFNNLLAETFGVQKISFINLFFKHSLIKKRIVMLGKNKSKQVLKLKYLLLIPVLVSMLVYTSCEKGELVHQNKNEKRPITLYFGIKGKKSMNKIDSKKEGYFDIYIGDAPKGKEIFYDDLTNEEQKEYDITNNKLQNESTKIESFKIYEMNDGKRALSQIIDWEAMKLNSTSKDYSKDETVPYAEIKKSPIFPGCEDAIDKKKCLQDKIKEHVSENFNKKITNNLEINSEFKIVYVQFTIDKNGTITKTRARGPHKATEKEAIRVIQSLPKMQPGEHNGEKVNVKYTLPINFVIQ
jgi:beta-lactamase regulating signal transducer with metallopeptidase domain